ncbi:hypothetical protein SAMN05216338_1001390 [Bradyrhizobium sp. Rc2d]|nr:hypothetical protein SAMN05216338_1001390 [Bradyrhizobium sp. Rc2d]
MAGMITPIIDYHCYEYSQSPLDARPFADCASRAKKGAGPIT